MMGTVEIGETAVVDGDGENDNGDRDDSGDSSIVLNSGGRRDRGDSSASRDSKVKSVVQIGVTMNKGETVETAGLIETVETGVPAVTAVLMTVVEIGVTVKTGETARETVERAVLVETGGETAVLIETVEIGETV